MRGDPDADQSLEPVQIQEGTEYRYEFALSDRAYSSVEVDAPEVFIPDKRDGLAGRLRPGLFTGTLPIAVRLADGRVARVEIEVRSRKLDYLSQYRWMLRDIAWTASELIMEGFNPTEQRFAPDAGRDPATLYQRFAFLKSVLADEGFVAAVHRVLARPHVTWRGKKHEGPPGRGWPGGSAASRQLASPGRRVAAPNLSGLLGEAGVPERLSVLRAEPSVDNEPNRFVKFALSGWRDLAASVVERVEGASDTAANRGLRDAKELRDELDSLLAEELFREVGDLARLPSNDQVLQKREGYRDVFRAYVLSEVAAQLNWKGGDDVYGAGQKNVATLYEYWAFLQVALSVADVCGTSCDWSSLLVASQDGLGLELRRGRATCFRGNVQRFGRRLSLELWFNRTFGLLGGMHAASWSRPMRPDCSLLITPSDGGRVEIEPVWLHFDAKYRVHDLREIMAPPLDSAADEAATAESTKSAEARGQARSDDLLKMHAYRDAIRRSAGAYVLYPGDRSEHTEEYHELLPGLGAFALQPTATGAALGAGALKKFLLGVLDHLALQVSQHERGRFWRTRSFTGAPAHSQNPRAATFLSKPPADTRVLLGYVKGRAHLDWILKNRRYNLRADERAGGIGLESEALAAELIVLYSPSMGATELWATRGPPEIVTRDRLIALGYPSPTGKLYLCLQLGENLTTRSPQPLGIEQILRARSRVEPRARRGEPVSLTWLDLVS